MFKHKTRVIVFKYSLSDIYNLPSFYDVQWSAFRAKQLRRFFYLGFYSKKLFFQKKVNNEQLLLDSFSISISMCIHAVWKLCLKIAIKSSLIVLILWFLIEIPLRGIGRNCAIIVNKEAIKYWRNCAELRVIACNGIAFPSKNQQCWTVIYTFMQQISEQKLSL